MRPGRPKLDERERILADLGNRRILGLRNRGLLTVGHSISRMQLAFQQSGAAFFPIRGSVVQDPYARFAGVHRNDPATFDWPALCGKLDRIDPSRQ